MKQTLVLVGGYLGAGKTTLLLKAAEVLEARGLCTALIMNDQGEDLVDTGLAAHAGREVRDVTGACFCCDFPEFVEAARSLSGADVILAEPVGSCTDIIRTVVHPLQEMDAGWIVAPFTVLIDPVRAAEMLAAAESDLAYLFRMQMAEADLLVASKRDLAGACPVPVAVSLSAKTGDGVPAWLDLVLGASVAAGSHRIAVDYDRYGAAEASLAWLNWTALVNCPKAIPALQLLGPFVEEIREQLRREGMAIAHLKALDSGQGGYLRVSLCGLEEEPSLEGAVIGDARHTHRIVLNLRAECPPEYAAAVVAKAARRLEGEVSVEREQCFRPAMPRPSVDQPDLFQKKESL